MASRKTCTIDLRKGFTVLEMLVVLGLLAFIGAMGLAMSLDSLRGGVFRNDRNAAVAALQRARSLAVNNMCFGAACGDGEPHGVRFDPAASGMIIFQGDSFDPADLANEEIEFDSRSVFIDAPSTVDIIFERISGGLRNAATSTDVVIKDGSGRDSTITISPEGRIDWTN